MSFEAEEGINVNRQLNIYKHIKKKAANDAQLLMYVITMLHYECQLTQLLVLYLFQESYSSHSKRRRKSSKKN